jgi:hypothetical protein
VTLLSKLVLAAIPILIVSSKEFLVSLPANFDILPELKYHKMLPTRENTNFQLIIKSPRNIS